MSGGGKRQGIGVKGGDGQGIGVKGGDRVQLACSFSSFCVGSVGAGATYLPTPGRNPAWAAVSAILGDVIPVLLSPRLLGILCPHLYFCIAAPHMGGSQPGTNSLCPTGKMPDAVNFWLGDAAAVTSCRCGDS